MPVRKPKLKIFYNKKFIHLGPISHNITIATDGNSVDTRQIMQ